MSDVDMPARWARARLDSIADVRLGRQRSPKRAFGPNMMPYLRAANVTWRGIDLADVKEMDFSAAEVETYRLKAGDILLAEASGSPSEVGKPALYIEGADTHCFQNTLIRVRPTPELTPFLYIHFLRDVLLGRFAKVARGVGIQHLGADALSAWEVVLPPIEEQARIVEAIDSYLTRLDDAIASFERVQAKLNAYRASVLKAAVEGRLVPTEACLARAEKRDYEPADVHLARILKERRRRWEEAQLAKLKAGGKARKDDKWEANYQEPAAPNTSGLPDLPEGWCWASPGQLSSTDPYSLGIGPFGSNLKVSDYTTEGTPLVFVRNIRAESFDDDEAHYVSAQKAEELRPHQVSAGDILITKMGDPPGDCCRYPLSRPIGVITADCIKLRVHKSIPCASFFVHAIRSGLVQAQIQSMTKGVAQKKVSLARFRQLALPLPPATEQQRIADRLDTLLSVANQTMLEAEGALRRCARLRQAILKWAFEGRLVDQDPTDEPADELLARIQAERAADSPTNKRSGRTARGSA